MAVLIGAGLLAGCGGGSRSIPLDPVSADTSVPDSTGDLTAIVPPGSTVAAVETTAPEDTEASAPETTAASSLRWVEATTNLEGLSSECGNLSFVGARPDADVVIAGVALQGLWASVDGAEEWVQLGQGAGSAAITNRMSALVDDPEQPDTFYESGIYNAGGVYRTTDGGTTFEQLGDVEHSDLVSVDFTDPARSTMLSGRHETPVLYRSSDAGATWADISAGLPGGIGYAASPHVIDAQTHLLGTRAGEASGIFRTTDGGATWSTVREGGVVGPVLAASDGNLFWALEEGAGVIVSADDGSTWTEVTGPGTISASSATLLELPDGRFASYNDANIIVSDDQGQTWETLGPSMPYTPSGIAYAPSRDAFYAWRFDCDFDSDNAVPPDAIVRLDLDAP